MKEILKRAEYPIKIEALPWARAYKIALECKNVIIFSMARSKERESLFHWIGKLRELNYTFYALKTNKRIKITSITQALHYTVVAVRNSVEAMILQQQGFISGQNLILTSGYIEAWQALIKGRAELTYANEYIGDSIYKSLGEDVTPFIKQPFSGMHSALYVAASKATHPDILFALNQALISVKNDGTFEKILTMKPALVP